MSAHWQQRPEGGGRFAIALIRFIGLHCGRPVARLILYPITLYFFFRRGPERRASRAYLSRVFGRPASNWQVLRHIHCFAATILDRVFLLTRSPAAFDIRVHGQDQIEALAARGGGVLLLGAHIGSFEALRALSLSRPDLRVVVLMDQSQTPALTELLHELNPAIAASVIDADQDSTAVVLALRDAAESGALIGLMADRARGAETTLRCDFLGAPAPFPVAALLLGAVLKIPLVLCFGLYRGGKRYDLHFETFAENLVIERAQRPVVLRETLQRYAARLEHYTRLAPYNWFNFYDFWQTDAVGDAAAGEPGAAAPRRRA